MSQRVSLDKYIKNIDISDRVLIISQQYPVYIDVIKKLIRVLLLVYNIEFKNFNINIENIINDILEDIFQKRYTEIIDDDTIDFLSDICHNMFRHKKNSIESMISSIRNESISYICDGIDNMGINMYEARSIGFSSVFSDFLLNSINNPHIYDESLVLETLIQNFNFRNITWSFSPHIKNITEQINNNNRNYTTLLLREIIDTIKKKDTNDLEDNDLFRENKLNENLYALDIYTGISLINHINYFDPEERVKIMKEQYPLYMKYIKKIINILILICHEDLIINFSIDTIIDNIIDDIFEEKNSEHFSVYTLKYMYDVCDYLFRCDKDDVKSLNDRIRDLVVSYLFNGSKIDTFELIGCSSIFADFLIISIDNILELSASESSASESSASESSASDTEFNENLNLEYLIAQFNYSDITWSLSNIKGELSIDANNYGKPRVIKQLYEIINFFKETYASKLNI